MERQEVLIPLRGEAWKDKRVLVVGLARSGLAAARLLLRAGAVPLLYDQKPQEKPAEELQALLEGGCTLCAAEDPLTLLQTVDSVVISPGVSIDAPLVLAAKERGIPLIGELELASRFARGKIIAVTGTNGKTTTVSLLGEILRNAGKEVQVAGNIGFPLSAAVLNAGEETLFVTEVSSFQLESVDGFHPHIAAILNLTPDHLNRHGSMAQYLALKERVFACQDGADWALLNRDCQALEHAGEMLRARKAWFSRREEVSQGAYLKEGQLWLAFRGERQLICDAGEVAIPGDHNLENALAASAMAGMMDIPPAVIRHSLRSFAGVEHRIEFVREISGIRFINDSKGTNPDASIRAVQAMQAPTILLAGGFDKQVGFDSFARAIAENRMIRHVILYGQTAPQIADALKAQGYEAYSFTKDMLSATDKARGMAEPGYNILLSPACASFDQFSDYEERGRIFKAHVASMPQEINDGGA